MDYSIPEVREWMLNIMKEVAERFDVDGLELDFVRSLHVFPTATAREKQALMTEFVRNARGMLNKVSHNKGKKLKLAVRVPQTLEEGHILGYDAPAWIRERLIDYISPFDFSYTDFSAPYDEFARLTLGTPVKLYPTVHPLVAKGYEEVLMSAAMYRAAASNFYFHGSNGISVFNFPYHWVKTQDSSYIGPAEMYPQALTYLSGLKDPEFLDKGDRNYVFYSLREGTETGLLKKDRIILDRDEDSYDRLEFTLAEDFGTGNAQLVRFNAVGLHPDDEVKVDVNGVEIAMYRIKRTYHKEGRTGGKEGKPLPVYTAVEFPLTGPPAVKGRNSLGVKLIPGKTVDKDRVLWLPFDEGAGKVATDKSGNGNNGNIVGAPWVGGIRGSALFFGGLDDYVDISSSNTLNLSEAITIEMWIKPSNLTEKVYQYLIDKYGYRIAIRYNELHFVLTEAPDREGSIYSTSDTNLISNEWSHVLASYDSNTLRIYKNGIQSAQNSSWNGTFGHEGYSLRISPNDNHPTYGNMGFHGAIDEVRIYSRAVGFEEIWMIIPEIEVGVSVSGREIKEVMTPWPGSELPTEGGPYKVNTADFTGDGIIDLALAYDSIGIVIIEQGNKDGSFSHLALNSLCDATNPSYRGGIYNIAQGDIDKDGLLDLAIGCKGRTVTIARNLGKGKFEKKYSYKAESYTKGVRLAYLDKDGLLDLLYTARGTGREGDTPSGKLYIRKGIPMRQLQILQFQQAVNIAELLRRQYR